MTFDDDGGTEPEETSQEGPAGSEPKAGFGGLTVPEQLMGLGAILILVVADLLGDIILDDYSIGQVTWIVAVAVVAAIWAHRLAGAKMPIPYRWTMIVLGYTGAIMGAREFINDIEADVLDGSTVFFALSMYVGAVLMAVGAYRMSRSD